MARFIIRGGKRISGTHRAPGNKNAVLPMLAASILTDDEVVLGNIPLIEDVRTMLAVLEDLGVDVNLRGHRVTLRAAGIRKRRLNSELCRKVRSSLLFAGPMAARHGKAVLPPPGGDVIGRRRVDTHFSALRELGISVGGGDDYSFTRRKLKGSRILLDEASVTATENVLMASVIAPGRTTIFNAACEPHVQDLCMMLNKMGARISGIGTNYLRIEGVEKLSGVKHRVAGDYIDAISFMAASVVTGGELTVKGFPTDQFDVIGRPFARLGVKWSVGDGSIRFHPNCELRVRNDFGGALPKIEDGVWPAFPSDLMSIAIVLATRALGTALFFEKMFESRMYFVDRLIEMGARIVQCDPHRIVVAGRSSLHATDVSSPDIRAGMALLIAALCAKGESIINNIESIDRGYERVDSELRRLGADIRRTDS